QRDGWNTRHVAGRLGGPRHPRGWVEVVVFPGRDVRRVGPAESRGNVERVVGAYGFLDVRDRGARDLAVPRVGVGGVEDDAAPLHLADDLLRGRLLRLP